VSGPAAYLGTGGIGSYTHASRLQAIPDRPLCRYPDGSCLWCDCGAGPSVAHRVADVDLLPAVAKQIPGWSRSAFRLVA
jgi:hypothetical protein